MDCYILAYSGLKSRIINNSKFSAERIFGSLSSLLYHGCARWMEEGNLFVSCCRCVLLNITTPRNLDILVRTLLWFVRRIVHHVNRVVLLADSLSAIVRLGNSPRAVEVRSSCLYTNRSTAKV